MRSRFVLSARVRLEIDLVKGGKRAKNGKSTKGKKSAKGETRHYALGE